MHKFHQLTIKSTREQPNGIIWTLSIPHNLATEFAYQAGQHLTFKAVINGEELRRSYSICSAPSRSGEIDVLIKAVDDGRFSQAAQSDYRAGSLIDVMPPSGHFTLSPQEHETYVAFAAGSGITPVMGMIYAVMENTETAEFILFYGNSKTSDVLLHDEIAALKDQFGSRLSLHFFLTRQQVDVPLYQGRFDADKVKTINKYLLQHIGADGYFVCGPGAMIDQVCETLIDLGIDPAKVHNERFLSDGQEISLAEKTIKEDAGVTVTIDGANHEFNLVAGTQATILESAESAGVDLPYSCKAGVCATCRCKLLVGDVEMINNYSLEEWETKAGYILSCQAVARSSKIHISFDE
ncbi:FAD-binding oxidoreductase [Marinicella sp. S1101]|uniref:2Fe-2S iron-sulfur cluster-binding protein n=1 Tax=Marinicella marina TaxID=2996016 RepID=UPI002260A5DB|nr:2Fe-2S iron-sulfur cluster-binding protein [Marinicella marina]MCX7554094.1 FAD-binding oxidoreductase [Marinicella marina]MDJ1141213.1 FAD-binding oxidoreductase [Marinicella marina]